MVWGLASRCTTPSNGSEAVIQPASSTMPTVSDPILLWPQGAPDEPSTLPPEKDTTTPNDNLVAGQPLMRLTNVSEPTITVYRPAPEVATGAAVVVCPGGGYHILAYDLEGTEICAWFNSIGVTAILLKYRVPVREGRPRYAPPLQDAQRAMGLVRAHAKEWQIDPKRVGVLGFSAGGHLSAALSTHAERTYAPVDSADRLSSRPDFAMLIYPAYLVDEQNNTLAPEIPVSEQTPPTLLVQTQDDHIPVENSLFYYLALKKVNVPAEMHLYATGGHGYGLRKVTSNVRTWPARAEEWLRTVGMIK